MDKTKWKSIMLPKQLNEQLETFSESDLAKNLGFTNKSQIAANAVREFLRNYSSYLTYLDYLGLEKKTVKIMDYNIGKVIELMFDSENEILSCKHDNSNNCKHVQFLWVIPRFKEDLKKITKPLSIAKSKIYTKEDILEGLQTTIRQSTYTKSKDRNMPKEEMIEILKKIIKDLEE